MRFFDLHCDTIYRILKEGGDIHTNDFAVSLSEAEKYEKYIGCFAICVTEDNSKAESIKLFEEAADKISEQICKYKDKIILCDKLQNFGLVKGSNKSGIVFTVEGGAAIAGDIKRVKYLYERGVRVVTLTWNGLNEIGDGSWIMNPTGITPFGIKVIRDMEGLGMIVDISHASDRLFYDAAFICRKPFIATHSNSRTVCNHKRNLTDEQFKIIKSVGGIVGINFYTQFLSDKESCSFADILKHIEYFLSLGGINTVCIGSDFDGADMPEDIRDISCVHRLYEYCLRHNYNEELLNRIFFGNAYDFFNKNIK